MANPKVIDADGHIYENHEEIEEYFEGKYRGMRRARAYSLFPSLDGWPRGLGAGRPGQGHRDETRRRDQVRRSNGARKHRALSHGRPGHRLVQSPDWACSISRAYNNWFHDRYIKQDSRLKGVAVLPVQDPQGAAARTALRGRKARHGRRLSAVGDGNEQGLRPPGLSSDLSRGGSARSSSRSSRRAEPRIRLRLFRRSRPGPRFGASVSADDPIHQHRLRRRVGKVSAPEDRFLEAGCGWLPYMMDRLDYEYETRGGRSFPNMKKKPSAYIKDCPVYVTCEPEETSLELT